MSKSPLAGVGAVSGEEVSGIGMRWDSVAAMRAESERKRRRELAGKFARSHPSRHELDPDNFVGYKYPARSIMAAKGKRIKIKLRSTESPYTYHKTKNARLHPERIEMKKYDPVVKKHVLFKETK